MRVIDIDTILKKTARFFLFKYTTIRMTVFKLDLLELFAYMTFTFKNIKTIKHKEIMSSGSMNFKSFQGYFQQMEM